MAVEFNLMVRALKKNPELGQKALADELDVSVGEVSMVSFCKAQVEAGIYSEAPATPKSVQNLRDREQNRWELIMARTGLSRAKVIEAYGGEEAAKESFVGRGRNFTSNGESGGASVRVSRRGGGSAKTKTASAKTKTASKKKSAAAGSKKKSAASGRKAAASKTGIVRNRQGRRSSASNPS